MKLKLYTGCILWHPNAEQIKENKNSEIVVSPTTFLAESPEQAKVQLILRTPQKYTENTSQLEYLIRDF